MKKSTAIIATTVLTLGVVGGVAAYKGDGFGHHGWHRGEHFIAHVRDELDLTPEQTEALTAIRNQLHEIRNTLRQDPAARTQTILALIEGEAFDQARALQLIDEKTALVGEYAPQVVASVADFYNGLSAAQQAQVRERINAHLQRHR